MYEWDHHDYLCMTRTTNLGLQYSGKKIVIIYMAY